MKDFYRYKGLVNYIAERYSSAVEIGVGHFPDVAFALQKRGIKVFATDIIPFYYDGLSVIKDDVMEPDLSKYLDVELIYSLRTPSELILFILRLARRLKSDLIVKPLHSEFLDGKIVSYGNTTFLFWSLH
ncbi:MAG: UPF0146 family protein [Thermodesulfovibrionales bacterium]